MTENTPGPEHPRELTMRFLAEPGDVNYGGKVHGGIVMKWIDQAGYAAAVGWCGRYAVTVAVGGIRFVAPIGISDLVAINAKLVYTGSTSMHIAVDVTARDPMGMHDGGQERLCTHCVIVFVAVDQGTGRPVPVPQLTQESDEDRRLAEYAIKVMDLSKDIEHTIARYRDAETEA
ncbi:MAG: acyl-CoA thioesterase [Proteobacteria bacterium]|nr:acyl-CoA thioesterase [Pseudomonadota bacterium]MBS0217259.1 acyl-CoA thioesterase [Pseudomonadota bacterium]